MSTTPTPEPTPTTLTPTPEAPALDFSSPAADLRAAAVAAEQTPATPAPAEPTQAQPAAAAPEPPPYTVTRGEEGIEVKLASGATYRGSTEAEVLEKLAAGKFEADRTIRQLRTQTPPTPPPVDPPAPVAPAESPEEIQARDWILEQQAKAFGMTKDQYANAVRGMMQTANEMQVNTLAAQFMQLAPDFPNTTEASDAILQIAQSEGLPMTPKGLKAAHLLAISEGVYKPIPPPAAANTRPTPAPMLNTQTAPQVSAETDLYSMPMDKLRELASRG